MTSKALHRVSGIIIAVFAAIHIFNHLWSVAGAEQHIRLMNLLRSVYRIPVVEFVLLTAVVSQVATGIMLFRSGKNANLSANDKLQRWTGLYLAFFLTIHTGAVLTGRYLLHLDTNFYFGVAGTNTFPFSLFFVPYYALAIFSFFGHLSAIHRKKMAYSIIGVSPSAQATIILLVGIVLVPVIFYGLTNHFQGVQIPDDYGVLIGR